jgi:hypothetical protein
MKVILKTYIKHIHLILKVYMNGRGDSHLMCVNLFLFDGCEIYKAYCFDIKSILL